MFLIFLIKQSFEFVFTKCNMLIVSKCGFAGKWFIFAFLESETAVFFDLEKVNDMMWNKGLNYIAVRYEGKLNMSVYVVRLRRVLLSWYI